MALLAVLVGLFQLLIGLVAWRSYRIGSWDLTLFDTIVRAYAHFRAPIEPALGTHLGVGPDLNAFGDHFSPILALLAPLYWVYADPRMLILAQALLVAVSTAVTWRIAERAMGPAVAYAVALGFGLAWPLQEASLTGFHESLFVAPLLLLAFERLQAGRPGQAALWAAALVTVKEDMGLLTAFFGLLLVVRRERRLGAALAVFGLAMFWFTSSVVVPHYWGHGSPDGDYYRALKDALPNPADTFDVVLRPVQKEQTLGWLLLPWAFLPLLSSAVLVVLPQVGERFASSNPNHWGLMQHYNAVLLPAIVVAGVETARRMPRAMQAVWAVWVVVAAVWLTGRHPGSLLWDGDSWKVDARERAAASAVAAVPHGVTVEADNEIGPHLARHDTVLLLDRTPRDAPWVVVDTGVPSFPVDSLAAQRQRVVDLVARGYALVLDNGQYAVLHRP
ncbi:putative membrane protein DUF2079 [Motilibacter peucedani]|uniref:Putative membrane protein DUF2079 n=1 Tax=Motilibacter peucedani TaxID=598650 RepID=A0A420XLQ8_9ACTN|nr:putative membrane protein DUF2079 [Motilibacter peucedani]